MQLDDFERLAQRRKTVKVLAQQPFPTNDHRDVVQRIIAAAGWAPFHKICSSDHRADGPMCGIQPWRFHALDAVACRRLQTLVAGREAAGKIPAMLAAADAMIMSTWLPNPPVNQPEIDQRETAWPASSSDSESFEATLGNVEHIAAASAAVQSLLLAATSAGFETYWSSGGLLRTPEIFAHLGISARERLLGAIFLFPAEVSCDEDTQVAESKLRSERSPVNQWSRWV